MLNEETDFFIEIKDVEYQVTLTGYKHTAYFIMKSLPVIPRIGEEISIPFFKEYVGEEYFYIKNIRYDIYDNRQVVSIQLEGGHYNKWWHYRRDEAIEKGEVDYILAWFSNDRSLKKEIGARGRRFSENTMK